MAAWLVALVVDSQLARNSLWEEAVGSVVCGLALLSFSAALDHYLLFESNPLKVICEGLTSLALQLGPLASETVGGMSEGDTTWVFADDAPNGQQLQQDLLALRSSLTVAKEAMIEYRLGLSESDGVRFDRTQYAVVVAADELLYHDGYGVVQVVRDAVASYQVGMQAALAARAARHQERDPHHMEASQ